MSDLYREKIDKFMLPMDALRGPVHDAMYFLRKDGSFVFSEGYCHPAGGLYGKIIYYPDPDGSFDIFGRPYGATNKHVENGEIVLTSHRDQILFHYEIDPSLGERGPIPVFAEYHTVFYLDEFAGYFDHRHSLRKAMEMDPAIEEAVSSISRDFRIPVENLGTTGSLSYGKFEHPLDDIDLTIYGSVAENRRIIREILELTREPDHRVVEFGKFWPMRFYYNGIMICSFFQYLMDEEIPLRDIEMTVVKDEVAAEGIVSDATHTIYMPSIVMLTDAVVDGGKAPDIPVIMYDGSLRGEFYRGERLGMRAKLVRMRLWEKERECILVTLSEEIRRAVDPGR